MTTTANANARMFHDLREGVQARLTPDDLIRETHAVFDSFGVTVPPSKISRIVRTYLRRVQDNGYDFGAYIATQVAVSEMQRKVIADELRKVVGYADPTGEFAVSNVLKERRHMDQRRRR